MTNGRAICHHSNSDKWRQATCPFVTFAYLTFSDCR